MPILEAAAQIRRELRLPRFEQSDWHAAGYWASKFGRTPSEWAAIEHDERAEMIATSMIEDAMELVSSHPDKVKPVYGEMSADNDIESFVSGM